MTLLQRILLIPSLLPLVVVLVLSVLHRGEPTRLHLLGWSSPEVPLGVWTALAATGAAGLAASSSFLRTTRKQPLRRRLHRSYEPVSPSSRQEDFTAPHIPVPAPPQRDLRDPAPTVAVAYRVIKRGVPHQHSNHAADVDSVQRANETVPRSVSDPLTPKSTPEEASEWGDDPNRDW